MKSKKALKITRNILLGILAFLLLFLIVNFIADRILRSKEMKLLDEKGYVNRVSVGDYSLNVFIYGSDEPEHTIVGMAGMGVDDFACTGRYVTDGLSDKNKIVYVDRAGYGLSDDSGKSQTIGQIISDYRTALKNAGVEAPYVLMPHSIAGPYAAYWASQYPDEIEGVFFLDGSEINGEDFEDLGDVSFADKLYVLGSSIGLGRIYDRLFDKEIRNYPKKEDVDVSWAMYHCKGSYSKAKYSEADLQIENMRDAWNGIRANDVPKMYICASSGIQTVEELDDYMAYQEKISGESFDLTQDGKQKIVDEIGKFRKTNVEVFCDHVGNCELRLVPGDHYIFIHKPEKVRECFEGFLDGLDPAK